MKRINGVFTPGIFAQLSIAAFAVVASLMPMHAHAAATTLTVTNGTGEYGDTVTVTATLTDGVTPIAGETIDFTNGVDTDSAVTDANGEAQVTLSLTGLNAGSYADEIDVTYAGNLGLSYDPSTDSSDLTVTPIEVSVTGITAANKIYDGSDVATLDTSLAALGPEILAGDVGNVTLDASAADGTFDDKDVDTGKTVTVTDLALTGSAALNYEIGLVTTTADITERNLIVSINADSRPYDGTVAATVSYSTDKESGDTVTVSGTATFADMNANTGILVTASGLSLGGADAGNYVIANVGGIATDTADITPRVLTADVTVSDKIYDGTDAAAILTRILNNVVGVEDVTVSGGTALFINKHVGTNKTVDVTGLTLGGTANLANYSFDGESSTTADISQYALTVTAQTDSKVYDNTASSSVLPVVTVGTLQGSDTAVLTQAFADENAGTGKTIVPAIAITDGNGGANYAVTLVNDTTGTITPATLTITADNLTKQYGDANPTATASYAGFAVGESSTDLDTQVTLVPSASANSDVGDYAILAFGATDANYTILHVNGNLAVTPRTITITASASDKVYDGTTDASASVSVNGILFTDVVGATFTAAHFADENVGSGKSVTLSGVSLTGGDSGNYSVASTANTTAAITERAVTVTADAQTKVYGAADPALSYAVTSGSVASGDSFSGALTRATGEDVGTYAINQGTLTLGGNYTLSYTGALLTVTPAALTITADDKTRAYGEANPSLTATYTGFVNGDDEGDLDADVVLATAADSNSDTGTYPITATGASDANYTITHVDGTLTIVKADQTITFGSLSDKDYGDADFTVAATASSNLDVTFSATGACTVSGDTVHLTTKGTCTITADQSGNANWNAAPSVSQSFTVYDVTGPVITLTGDAVMTQTRLDAGFAFVDPGYSAVDDVDGSVAVTVTGTVDAQSKGTYVLTYNAVDAEGNAATPVTRTVNVVSAPRATGGGGGGGGGSAPRSNGGEVLGASTYAFSADISYGMSGQDVIELQKVLIAEGFLKIPAPTGYFGPLTLAAVKAYQAAHGIIQTGYVGPLTRAALNGA